MLALLQALGYQPPEIRAGRWGRAEVTQNSRGNYYLHIDGNQWMVYQTNHEEAYQVFSHYCLAQGHVIVTGMGFGSREQWLLSKPGVTRLTVVEKNPEIIQYHRDVGSAWIQDPRVDIQLSDAADFRGQCDVLLADHYELESFDHILRDVRGLQDRVQCQTLWFWPLERIIMHCRKWHSDNDPPYSVITKHEAYQRLRRNHGLDRLPDLTPAQIDMFCMMHHSHLFSRSENMLQELWPDRKIFHDVYRYI